MSSYAGYTFLVDNDNVGIRRRTRGFRRGSGKGTSYYRHPLVRNDWWTKDKFRGAQGYYFAQGKYKGRQRLFDFSKHPWWSKNIKRPLKLAGDGRFTESSFTVFFDAENWNLANRHKRSVLDNYLAKTETSVLKGDPNFYQYLAGNLGESDYYKSYYMRKWRKLARFSPLIRLDTIYSDHLNFYRYPSTRKRVLAKSSYNLQVNSYYNFYLDTMPPYEEVTNAAGRDAELILPNLYMLESDIQNTASVNYTDQLTLNNASNFYDGPELDVWFLEQNQTSPEGNKSYYQQFSETLDILNNNGGIAEVKETFKETFRNVAILYPDLNILKKYNIRDDRGTPNDTSDDVKSTAFYPFYNEIIIGFDKDDVLGIGGTPAGFSFFTSLFASKLDADDVRSFVTLLQLYIIERMRTGATEPMPSKAFTRETIKTNGRTRDRVYSFNKKGKIVFKMDDFINALKNDELDYLVSVYNESKEEMADAANYTILREWENEELFKLNIKDAIKVVDSSEFEEAMDERKRSLRQVFNNDAAPSETIMYLIEKRINPRGPRNIGPLIQTFMVSKDVVYSDLLRYVDTQVLYGVRYNYKIKQVRVVFGNEYSYDGITFDFGSLRAGQGRAVGNALGFYEPIADEHSRAIVVDGQPPSDTYEYHSPNSEPSHATSHIGHFVFTLPESQVSKLISSGTLPAATAQVGASPTTRYYQAIRNGTADMSGLIVELHSGLGTDGNTDGGMTGYDIRIPPEVEEASDADLIPVSEEEETNVANPVIPYRRAIDILVGEADGSQEEVIQTVEEISSIFRGLLETGAQQQVNTHLQAMARHRDSFARPLPGAPSVVVNDPRTQAARSIYTQIDAKVRELMDTVVVVTDDATSSEAPKDTLLAEVLGTEQQPAQHSQQTAFEGIKGNAGLNMRIR